MVMSNTSNKTVLAEYASSIEHFKQDLALCKGLQIAEKWGGRQMIGAYGNMAGMPAGFLPAGRHL